MLTNCTIARESEGDQIVYRVTGVVDRASAWALRQTIESESEPAVLLDFSLVRDFSDLGVAVLAHGLIGATRRVLFRGLRQHQVRIFRYSASLRATAPGARRPAVSRRERRKAFSSRRRRQAHPFSSC
jgi:anti-anti-sigma regulatory factor